MTSCDWKVGDEFVFINDNRLGGSEYGTPGDRGVITDVNYVNHFSEVRFHYVSIVTTERRQAYREEMLHDQTAIWAYIGDIRPLIVAYEADQEADDDEDLL